MVLQPSHVLKKTWQYFICNSLKLRGFIMPYKAERDGRRAGISESTYFVDAMHRISNSDPASYEVKVIFNAVIILQIRGGCLQACNRIVRDVDVVILRQHNDG